MTPEQIALVQRSFAQVLPMSETAARLFYNRLFEMDPSLKALFHVDITEQGRKLMDMLRFVVAGLDHVEKIVPAIQELGRRHASYGVIDGQYETVGAALIWTLEQGLKEQFTPETKAAWTAAYTLLAATMQESGGAVTRGA